MERKPVNFAKLAEIRPQIEDSGFKAEMIETRSYYYKIAKEYFDMEDGEEKQAKEFEAVKAMGASNGQIIFKVLLPESMPAIVSGIAVTGISLVGYTAMAGAIGAGGLGNLAYMYGFARRNDAILYSSTVIIVLIVFVIQWIGDAIVKKIDKR